ncbi:hypothetical protein AFLA_013471 [Aspergillus flavus NRRL3357]|nr:hypothetical protein AFLA_013471 [Aspergillus flavus NRRL3357]
MLTRMVLWLDGRTREGHSAIQIRRKKAIERNPCSMNGPLSILKGTAGHRSSIHIDQLIMLGRIVLVGRAKQSEPA